MTKIYFYVNDFHKAEFVSSDANGVIIPRIGETVFLEQVNGPLKVQDIRYSYSMNGTLINVSVYFMSKP